VAAAKRRATKATPPTKRGMKTINNSGYMAISRGVAAGSVPSGLQEINHEPAWRLTAAPPRKRSPGSPSRR
jgi:hypothetical protein